MPQRVTCADCGAERSPSTGPCAECGGTSRNFVEQVEATMSITTEVQTVCYPRLSEAWLDDVRDEETREPSRDARRRQIVAAATFADSYLYEWVRDEVLRDEARRWEMVFELFPEDDRRGVLKRWKEVPKDLLDLGLIPGIPDLGQFRWEEFRRLISYRDGLVHGTASCPEGSHFPPGREPVPTMAELEALEPNWATNTVLGLIGLLHEASRTEVPDWALAE